jgi:hypothetical protein|tara:strand:+ start:817 stop:1110 length:294 start_codon:yes stop_codon:yes gene_type:complete
MKNDSYNPVEYARAKEVGHAFMGFCSFVSIINNKKINLPNIFIMLLKDSKLRTLFKELLEIDTDFEMVKMFLFYEPSLHKSKYIMKYLNSKKKKLIS